MRTSNKLFALAGGALLSTLLTAQLHAQGKGQQNQQTQQNQSAQQNQQGQEQGANAGNAQANANAQGNFNGGISQSPWFSNPTIRQQIQMNDEQFNKMNNAYMQSFNRYNQGVVGLGNNLNETQRAQRLQELNQGFSNEFSKATDGLFTDNAARQRFNQYDMQYRGYGAFNNPNVQQQLKLTDEQIQRLNKYNSDWNNQMGIWHREYSNDRDRTSESFREARREAQNRINTTLTPEQRKIWNNMIGKPIDWPADVYFPNPVTSGSTDTSETNR